jgi:oxygen-independent coproporphyrinogen-3 oxidase
MTFKANHYASPAARSLYVHVPLCAAKCRYCDFYSLPADRVDAGALIDALAAELESRGRSLQLPLRTIFVGGGTPTALATEWLDRLLAMLAPLAQGQAEFTVEANPGTLGPQLCTALRSRGVNRLSIGVQSFVDDELATLGRIHNARQARQAVRIARDAGFDDISLDLIYGVPGQSLASWRRSLDEALALEPEHLSTYALSFEKGTELDAMRQAGRVSEVDEGLQEQCYRLAIAAAGQAGLEHYEISNFARPHRRCQHNLVYWHNEPYLGVGPAAASCINGVRSVNRPDLGAYLTAVSRGQAPPRNSEQLTGRDVLGETLMLGLRLIEGVDRQRFADRFGTDPAEAFPETVGRYVAMGALELTETHLRITSPYLFVADTILADILAEA